MEREREKWGGERKEGRREGVREREGEERKKAVGCKERINSDTCFNVYLLLPANYLLHQEENNGIYCCSFVLLENTSTNFQASLFE